MRKLICYILCSLVLLLSLPQNAMASESSKQAFIRDIMHMMDVSMNMNSSYWQNMQHNTSKINFKGELTESSYQSADGSSLSNLPCKGSFEIISNLKKEQFQIKFDGQVSEHILNGLIYFSQDELIIPRDTVESLANLGIEELPDIEELDEMYDYVVIKPVLSNEDWSLLKESMIYNNDIYNNKDEVKAFVREFLNTIPASYFSYHDGYFVLDLRPSILGSAEFISNLKNNSKNLAEKFVAIMSKPPNTSDEEFAAMKEEMVNSIVEGIESLQISDLADLDLPFAVNEFKILSKYNAVNTSIHISSEKESKLDLKMNSYSTLSGHNNYLSRIDINLLLDSPETFLDLTLNARGTNNAKKSVLDLDIAGEIIEEYASASGRISFDASMEYNSKARINLPVLNENNSLIVDVDDTLLYTYEGEEVDDGKLKIYIEGYHIDFYEAQPVIINSCTMVPLRETCYYLGGEVNWQEPDTVILSNGYDEDLVLKINSTTYQQGEQAFTMASPPFIIDGLTYVPIRLLAEYFGYTVEWDGVSQSIHLF
ncbi:MAG: copper amine oxidase N-terminal domain-containing protein [Syntrophomonadaceae bacterium]|nr:copper amine oxidase N-terminal domain-containing protein [Syntrophomonadaceae bacterium]